MSYTNFITQDGYEGKKNNLKNIAELARKNVINKQNRRDFLYRVRRNTAESEVARATKIYLFRVIQLSSNMCKCDSSRMTPHSLASSPRFRVFFLSLISFGCCIITTSFIINIMFRRYNQYLTIKNHTLTEFFHL